MGSSPQWLGFMSVNGVGCLVPSSRVLIHWSVQRAELADMSLM